MNAALYIFIALSAMAAAGILITKNVFHAALWLIFCLIAIAGIYLILHAEFLAVTQIMIYAGGVVVLILFGIMLTSRLSAKGKQVLHQNVVAGLVVSAGLLAILLFILSKSNQRPALQTMDMKQHAKAVGQYLFTDYAAPFEVTGLLLLVSLVIAAVIASQLKSNDR